MAMYQTGVWSLAALRAVQFAFGLYTVALRRQERRRPDVRILEVGPILRDQDQLDLPVRQALEAAERRGPVGLRQDPGGRDDPGIPWQHDAPAAQLLAAQDLVEHPARHPQALGAHQPRSSSQTWSNE